MARLAELEEIAEQEREAELARQASELAGKIIAKFASFEIVLKNRKWFTLSTIFIKIARY